jgi:hypothetical protein
METYLLEKNKKVRLRLRNRRERKATGLGLSLRTKEAVTFKLLLLPQQTLTPSSLLTP